MSKTQAIDIESSEKTIASNINAFRDGSTLGESIADILEFWVILQLDTADAFQATINSDSGLARRTFIRTGFSAIEGMFSTCSRIVLTLHNEQVFNLTPEEELLIREELPRISENGEIKCQRNFPATDSKVRHLFTLVVRQSFKDYKLDVNCKGWESFKHAIKRRNDLMHPRNAQDLSISDNEVEAMSQAIRWFFREIVFATIATALVYYLKLVEKKSDLPDENSSDLQIKEWLLSVKKNGYESLLPEGYTIDRALKEYRGFLGDGGIASEKVVFLLAGKAADHLSSMLMN